MLLRALCPAAIITHRWHEWPCTIFTLCDRRNSLRTRKRYLKISDSNLGKPGRLPDRLCNKPEGRLLKNRIKVGVSRKLCLKVKIARLVDLRMTTIANTKRRAKINFAWCVRSGVNICSGYILSFINTGILIAAGNPWNQQKVHAQKNAHEFHRTKIGFIPFNMVSNYSFSYAKLVNWRYSAGEYK